MGPIDKVYHKIKHFCLPTGTKHDYDVWTTGIRIAKVLSVCECVVCGVWCGDVNSNVPVSDCTF